MTTPTDSPLEAATELGIEHEKFRDELLASELLVDAGEPGLYGRSGAFEDIVAGLQQAYVSGMAPHQATRMLFAPVFPRREFELTGYIASFPNLTGSINTFIGGDREHAALLAARARGEAWDSWLSPAETTLVPAVCHPLYGRLSGQTLVPGGRVFDVVGYVFRHEPSIDPMRMQVFRQHEFVYVGDAAGAREFRASALNILLGLLLSLGLDARAVAANDPFFGRAGRMLARNQLNEELKLEIVVPIYGDLDEGTAVASANCHEDHFGEAFEVTAADGSVAHSACIGAGLERIVLALLRTHGLDSASWPAAVRTLLSWSS